MPPVRRPISFSRSVAEAGWETLYGHLNSRQVFLLESGTTALALAMLRSRQRHAVEYSEIILPAYGCPDLISACIHAGARPRLVDIASTGWGYDPEGLDRALRSPVAAIVAVNLLGVGDEATKLAPKAAAAGATLIQDSAQYLPRQTCEWLGDYAVLSFGRGKPLNLLRGGALVARAHDGDLTRVAENLPVVGARERLLSSRLAGLAFNVMTLPQVFGWMLHLPGLGLGGTVYKPLTELRRLPARAAGQVGPAMQEYRNTVSYRIDNWKRVVPTWEAAGYRTLADLDGLSSVQLLRLPVLAPNRPARDRVVASLNRAGLGASPMYGLSMPELPGVPGEIAAQGPFPNARKFADRLFTLPTHGQVDQRVVSTADEIIRAARG